jgi:DNA-binding CsgD family transcriptional regulator
VSQIKRGRKRSISGEILGSDTHAPAIVAGGAAAVMPPTDPAYPMVISICKIVPASHWAFARVGLQGNVELTLASDGNGPDLPGMQTEFNRQRLKAKVGPRIAAALGPLGAFESGITLLFADAARSFCILTLLRTAALGPFTSTEISMLSFALATGSDRFSGLRLQPPEIVTTHAQATADKVIPAESPDGELYVLDRNMEIVLAWNPEDQRRVALTGFNTRVAEHLPALLEETVRELTAGWGIDSSTQKTGIARPVPFLVVRTQPLSGPTGLFIGVRIDRFHPPSSLIGAATRFHISAREVQVLALLLDGTRLAEIGKRLHISSSTVQDHIRSMVEKTGSGNRSELIARVLGWESTLPPMLPETAG